MNFRLSSHYDERGTRVCERSVANLIPCHSEFISESVIARNAANYKLSKPITVN